MNEDTCLNTDYLTLLSQICLAQAQECILEKSILDHKKPTIIVKVAAQIVEFYKQVMVKLEGAKTNLKKSCGNDYIKIISKYSQYKMLFYNAVAQFFMGVNQEDESKWYVFQEKSLNFQKCYPFCLYQVLGGNENFKASLIYSRLFYIGGGHLRS